MRSQSFAIALLALLFASTTHAQAPDDGFNYAPEPESAPPRLHTPQAPDPAFPLRVFLRLDRNRWVGDYKSYTGNGQFVLAGGTQRYRFSYDCPYSFPRVANETFQARWADAAQHKLQILLYDPRAHTTRTCSLSSAPTHS